jgi:hypothetical protein
MSDSFSSLSSHLPFSVQAAVLKEGGWSHFLLLNKTVQLPICHERVSAQVPGLQEATGSSRLNLLGASVSLVINNVTVLLKIDLLGRKVKNRNYYHFRAKGHFFVKENIYIHIQKRENLTNQKLEISVQLRHANVKTSF